MKDIEAEILELREKTNRNRRNFLRAEVDTCFIAVQRALYELSLGNTMEAKKELDIASRGAEVMTHFLGEAPEQLPVIEAKLSELRGALEKLASDIERAGP